MARLIVFDADGTLRRTTVPGAVCPHADGEWALLPGVAERLSALPWAPDGPYLAVASNQDHVGWGLLAAETARALLVAAVRAATGGRVTDPWVAFCPHPRAVGCRCRKPAPGMLLDALAAHRVPASEALFVGDAPTDAEAARAAGVPFVWAWDFFGSDRDAWFSAVRGELDQ